MHIHVGCIPHISLLQAIVAKCKQSLKGFPYAEHTAQHTEFTIHNYTYWFRLDTILHS
jgi:hypothetical protein